MLRARSGKSIAEQLQGLLEQNGQNHEDSRESFLNENHHLEAHELERKNQEIEKLKLENEGKKLENQRKELEIKTLNLNNNNLGQDIKLRLYHSFAVGAFLIIWAMFVGLFLWFWGENKLAASDTVVITLISTSTAQFVGIYLIVANYLFPKPKKLSESR